MKLMNHIDFLEYILARLLPESSRINSQSTTRLTLYLVWIYWIHPDSYYNDDYLFSAILWLIYDVQIFLDWYYISGDEMPLFKRQANYKLIDLLSDIAIFWFIYNKQNDLNMVILLLVILSIDFILNCLELANHYCRKEEKSQEDDGPDQGEENKEFGGQKLFLFSILIGSIYSCYTIILANNYGNTLREEQEQQAEVSDEASQIEVPFVCGSMTVFFDMIGQIVTNCFILYLTCKVPTPLLSSWQDKNLLLFVYGAIVGMMNFFMTFIVGLAAFCYFMYRVDKLLPESKTTTVRVVEGVEVTTTVEVPRERTPTMPGWYGD